MRRVYFIKPIGMIGPIKIGCSMSPNGRRSSLQFWSPFPLEIVAEIDGDMRLERRFHARFQHLFVSHEWFRAEPELLDTIEAIKVGAFDVEALPPPKVLHNTPQGARRNWSPEARRSASLTHRCRFMRDRSGFYFSGREGDWHDPAVLARVEAYLEAPHVHGVPCKFGKAERTAWLTKVNAA